MSEENVEVVRRTYADWEGGSFPADPFHEDVRIVWLEGVGIERETTGLVNARRNMADWVSQFDHATITAEKIIDAGEDTVVVIAVWHARGRASDAATEWRHGQVWTIREGKATSLVSYSDPDEALAAAGVSS